ncbi:MAG TPA: NDP-sugar synthase, partial [Candidatus Acidoferrales bacterium]|nr:NDP-sugar synthase [Candidatus Acidoferrales bacterium]
VEDPSQFGVVETDRDGRVLRFVEKPKPGETDARDINAGTYILEPEALDAIPSGQKVSIERETFPKLIQETHRVFAVSTPDYWIDVGRPATYTQAHRDILDGIFEQPMGTQIDRGIWSASGAPAPHGVALTAPVYLGERVAVERGAKIGPYAVLYDGCKIAKNATVSNSVLWSDCFVGREATVRDAILGLEVVVEPQAVVEPGSVLGRDERVTARTP